MTDETGNEAVHNDPEDLPADDYLRPDDELALLQRIANDTGIGLSVTLLVDGTVVSGVLCSGKKFFEAQAEMVEAATLNSDEVPDLSNADAVRVNLTGQFAGLLRRRAAEYPEKIDSDDSGDDSVNLVYFHLEEVRVAQNGRTTELNVWRGRLSHVSGWALGNAG